MTLKPALTLIPLGDDAGLVCDGDVCAVPDAAGASAAASSSEGGAHTGDGLAGILSYV